MGKKGKKETETSSKETFDPLPVETKAPATVVLLLNSQEEDVLVKACEAIYTFAEKGNENKVSLLEVGALEPLCKLISHSNNLVRRNAIMALGSMSTNGEVKNALKKLDAIPSIIEKLSMEEDVVVHEFSTLCLASLSVDYVSMVQIFESNGLPPVIQLLSSPDPDVQKNSLEIIFNLVQDYQSRQAVHELGGIVPLLELFKSDFPVIQQLALKVLQNVTMDLETRNTFRKEQGYEKLMEILSNQDFSDLHSDVLLIVANCLCDGETVHSLAEDGGLAKLMDFILLPSVPEIHANAIKCISRSAQSSECVKVLHEQGVEKVLVELLSVENVDVNISTCHAVAAMSLHLPSRDTVRDLGGVAKLVESMSSESLRLKEAASSALSNLTHHNKKNSMVVFEAGGHTLLIQQLSCSCPNTVANSAATLCNMAEQEKIRRGIWSHRAMEALVEPLKSTDSQTLVNSLQCLTLLACDSEARVEFQSAGGLPALVGLLRSHDKDVLAGACLAVVAVAIDEIPAVEMHKLGALELLEEINVSVNRKNKFSKLATTALLNSNLSVKYSLTSHLAATDIITHGFYDAGKARQGEKVPTLEELLTQPVNQQRPVVVVYMPAEQTTEVKEGEEKASVKEQHKTSRKKKKEEKEQKGKRVEVVEDVYLQKLIKQAKECVLPLNDREQYVTLARLVSDTMGGAVDQEKLHEFPWLLHLSELKSHLQSNVVPINLIKKAIYGERALLFKCLADQIGLSCSLVRAEYNRAFNEITLFDSPDSPLPRRYIVDLIHQPGNLLALNTPLALQYQYI